MPQLLISTPDKAATFDEFERLITRHLRAGLTAENVAAIRAHMLRIRQDPRPINVAMRFETFPEFESTRIIIDISPQGLPSIPQIRQ